MIRAEIRMPLVFSNGAWCVALPDYEMIPDSFEPVTADLIGPDGVLPEADPVKVLDLNPTVLVSVPDFYVNASGDALDVRAIRVIYVPNSAAHPDDPTFVPEDETP